MIRKIVHCARLIAASAAVSLGLFALPANAQDKIVLRVADSFKPTHYVSVQLINPWMDRVKELTKGRVEFKYFPSEQLAKSKDLLDAARNGIADITYVAPLYISDRLPLSGVVALPGIPGSASAKTAAYGKLVQDMLAEVEFAPESVVPLMAVTVAGYEIGLIGPPITSLDSIKGKKIRSSGGLQEQSVLALGASPAQIAAPELFAALERRTVDGTISPLASIKPYGMHEVLKSITVNANLGTFPITYVINTNVWKGLPDDVKTAMRTAAGEISAKFGAFVEAETGRAADALKEHGLELYPLPETVAQEFDKRAEPIGAEWAQKLDARGLPAGKVLEAWRASLKR